MSKKKSISKKSPISREKEKIATNLRHIYENSDGSLPDMKNFERGSSRRYARTIIRLLIFVGCVALGVVVWQGFIQPRLNFSNEAVVVGIEAPATAAPGQEVTYTIRYRNSETTPLARATLELHYPEGFTFVSASQPGLSGSVRQWEIGTVPARSSGSLVVVGALNADAGSSAVISAVLSYTPSNFNSVFEKVATATTVLSEQSVTMVFVAPSVAHPNSPVQITLKPVTPINRPMVLIMEPSAHFTFEGASQKPDQDGVPRWTFSKLDQEKVISMKGIFSGEAADNETFTARVTSVAVPGQSAPYLIATASTTAIINPTPLRVTLGINGKQSAPSVAPGDTINASVSVQNSGSQAVEHASVSLVFTAPSYQQKSILQWAELVDKSNGVIKGEQINDTTRRGSIVWTEKENPALASVAPGETVTFDVSVPIKDGKTTSLVNFAASAISISANVSASSLPSPIQSAPVNFSIHSDLDLDPRVESSGLTKDVTWVLTNSFHDLKDVRVEADLFGDFVWDENNVAVPVGKASFDPASKKVIWTIDQLPTNLDSSALQFSLQFNKKNPTQTELSSVVRVSATDGETGENISLSRDPMKME